MKRAAAGQAGRTPDDDTAGMESEGETNPYTATVAPALNTGITSFGTSTSIVPGPACRSFVQKSVHSPSGR